MPIPVKLLLLTALVAGTWVLPARAQGSHATAVPADTAWSDAVREIRNAEEFRKLKTADSVLAVKVRVNNPEVPKAELEKERAWRKEAMLAEFCTEVRFKRRGEVDSLPGATTQERDFCKRRLLVSNPLLP